jgi:hypothetical protein
MRKSASTSVSEPVGSTPFSGCLVRLFWMGIGNVALALCAVAILSHRGDFLSAADIVYWVLVPAMIVVRFVDIRKFGGRTAAGEPASDVHWRRYLVFVIVGSSALWAIAHVVAYFEVVGG